jgi:CRISPR-associated protein Cas2
MFVSVVLDPGSEGRAKELADLLSQYGFDKIQRGLWESAFVSEQTLTRLKKDLDRATDAFDRIRMFQFPVEGTLALSSLKDKKWRRMVAKNTAVMEQTVRPQPARPVQPEPGGRSRAAVRGARTAKQAGHTGPGRQTPRHPGARP